MKKTVINKLGHKVQKYIERAETRYLLSDKADAVYSDSSYVIYKDSDEDIYYLADNGKDTPYEIGNAQDLNEYLENEEV